ncbi:nucleoside deaminase [Swingsia samuiensis]|uniref:tRNA-specific adenosine deaminase n=1 Tax=Swingsia samuiensis TaxID=1293412 RepID=A0A4Y6UHJ1_9PROT|nr:nucleoside deaminase [Swingsia samuiensis]QDH17059.1 nucleoside deaminase [Swingsia samuiensis]
MIKFDTSHAMEKAFKAAQEAALKGEVPVGAVVLSPDGETLSIAHNRVEETYDASAHAELLAMRLAAQKVGSPRLVGCTVVVTLEPCAMCAAAISHFRCERLVFGAYDPKGGGVEHGARVFEKRSCFHKPEIIGGVRGREISQLLKGFFQQLR